MYTSSKNQSASYSRCIPSKVHSYWSACNTYTKRFHSSPHPPPLPPPPHPPTLDHTLHTPFSPELWTLLPTHTLLPLHNHHTLSPHTHLSLSLPRNHFHWECSSGRRVSGCPVSRPSPFSVGWWQSTWGPSKPLKQGRLLYTLGTGEGEERRRKRKVKGRGGRGGGKGGKRGGIGKEGKERRRRKGKKREDKRRKGERGEMGGSLCCNAGLVCVPGKLQNFVQTEREGDGRTHL